MEMVSLTKQPEAVIRPRNPNGTVWSKVKGLLWKDALMFLTLVGIVIGFAVGFGIRETHPSRDLLMWLGMPGELFLRVLRLMILPLVICSVISGTSSLDPKSNGKISLIAFIFIMSTNILAAGLGAIICVLVNPGVGTSQMAQINVTDNTETQDIFADLLRNIFPDNMVEATFKKAKTQYSREITYFERNTTNGTFTESLITVSKSIGKADSINVLGLIFICTIIGVAGSALKEQADVFLRFFTGATEIVLVIMRKFFCLAPIGIASLIAVAIAGIANVTETFSQLGLFVLSVTVGLAIHSFAVLPVILFVLTRRNPFAFILSIIRPSLIAFASGSSAAAIPEMIISCEENNKIDKRVTRFVVPFCVTMNADGSGLYITSSAIFIGQMIFGSVSAGNVVVIWILTSVAALAIPSVPSASIVTLIIIMTSLSIPTNDIAILFAVEWFLDRIRTSCNIVSHTFCTAVVFKFCENDLRCLDRKKKCNHEIP